MWQTVQWRRGNEIYGICVFTSTYMCICVYSNYVNYVNSIIFLSKCANKCIYAKILFNKTKMWGIYLYVT